MGVYQMYTSPGDEYYLRLLQDIIPHLQSTDISIIDMLFEIALDDNDLLTVGILVTMLLQPNYYNYHEVGS